MNGIEWEKSGDQGDEWHEAAVALPASLTRDYVVYFRATKVAGPREDIALDDILILDSTCGNVDLTLSVQHSQVLVHWALKNLYFKCCENAMRPEENLASSQLKSLSTVVGELGCSPGRWLSQGNTSDCSKCAAGTYKPEYGSMACAPCPVGFSTSQTGSTDHAQCCECLLYQRFCFCKHARQFKFCAESFHFAKQRISKKHTPKYAPVILLLLCSPKSKGALTD